MSDFSYKIIESYGVIDVLDNGWTMELNLVSFNDREPKYDIRNWASDKSKMGKGIRLTKEQLEKLQEFIEKIK